MENYNIREFQLTAKESNIKAEKITNSKTAYDIIKQFWHNDITIYESFFILLLDRANQTIGYVKISQGGIIGTVVDTKIIAKYCIDSLASGVILSHNHPSGNLTASDADIRLTEKLNKALALIDVNVLDHLILSENDYYSFKDNGIF